MKKIGVFDSGIGGLSVAIAIEKAFRDVEVIYVSDAKNLPYGTKTPEKLKELVAPKINELVEKGAEVVVIACNTVSTTILNYVKAICPVRVIGVEPMVEDAVKISINKVITVCATPTTLSSNRYKELKNIYASDIKVIEPDCSDWTRMIESDKVDREVIREKIESACDMGSDVIVLACTHYHWICELIEDIANGRAKVIHPEQKVVAELRPLISG